MDAQAHYGPYTHIGVIHSTMGLIKGLANINAKIAENESKFSGNEDYVPTKWFKLSDKQAVTVTPLQELDESNPGYSEKNGVGVAAVEHSNPKKYQNKAVCSHDDEGACLGCEENAKHPKTGWAPKTRLYLNVLVEDGINDPYVAVLSSGFGKGQIAPALIEFLNDVEEGDEQPSLTKTKFRIKRSGAGLSDTSYTVMPKGTAKVNPEDHEVFDLDKVLRHVPYGNQYEHYYRGVNTENSENEGEKELVSASSSAEAEW
jgi:hypothetical protein